MKTIFFCAAWNWNHQKLLGSTDLDRGLIVAKGMVTVCSCNDDYSYGSQFLRRFNIFPKNGWCTGIEIQIHISFVPRVQVNFHTFWGPNLKVPMFCKIEICIKLCVFIIDSKFRAFETTTKIMVIWHDRSRNTKKLVASRFFLCKYKGSSISTVSASTDF